MRVREGGGGKEAPLPNAHAHEEKCGWLGLRDYVHPVPYVAPAGERGWRAPWRAGTGVWEGGSSARGSEGRPRGAGGGSATLEGGEEAAARLWRAGSSLDLASQPYFSARMRIRLARETRLCGELEAAPRLRRAGRRRQRGSGGRGGRRQRGYGGRGGGCSGVLKDGEEAVSRRDAFPV